MSEQEVRASLQLNSVTEIGPARFQSLINTFGSAAAALSAGMDLWRSVQFFDRESLEKIKKDFDESRRQADRDWEFVQKAGVRLYLRHEGPYPELLKHIGYAPPVLYATGEDISIDRPAIAIVGSRRCSYYGEKMAGKLATDLAEAGVTTISGLARGIDTHVHRATIRAEGTTWAVIGSGLLRPYPPENKDMYREIEKSGAVISEFPMDTRPFPANFPRRNRIIAGLSRGTVVVEGTERSGSLITARMAAEGGRDVFAVPGPVTSELSAAPHRLLQMGAIMVQSGDDILREIGLEKNISGPGPAPGKNLKKEIPETYRSILAFLGAEPVPKETLAQRLNKDAGLLSSLLIDMELMGLVRMVSGGGVLKT